MSQEQKGRSRKRTRASRPGEKQSPAPAPSPTAEAKAKQLEDQASEADRGESVLDRLERLRRETEAEKARLLAEDARRRDEERRQVEAAREEERARKRRLVEPTAKRLAVTLEKIYELSQETGPVAIDPALMKRLRSAVRLTRGASRRLRWSLRP